MSGSTQNRRDSQRFPFGGSSRPATLVGDACRIDVEMINVSAGGFGVKTESEVTIEIGGDFLLETDSGSHEVVVAYALAFGGGREIGLQRVRDILPEETTATNQSRGRVRWLSALRDGDRVVFAGLVVLGILTVVLVLAMTGWSALAAPALSGSETEVKSVPQRRGISKRERAVRPHRVAQESIQGFLESLGGEFVLGPVSGKDASASEEQDRSD